MKSLKKNRSGHNLGPSAAKPNSLETLYHWVSNPSGNFHDRLYDLIESANDNERAKIESVFSEEVLAYRKFRRHDFQKHRSFWKSAGIAPGDGYIVPENERLYRYDSMFEPCFRCPHCKKDFTWDTDGDRFPCFIAECCDFQYRAYPTYLFLEIEELE